MALPAPNLDDRTFAQLVQEALARIATHCPEWTDLSVGDPGTALIDVFAYLTDTLAYRLNRVPEKAYIEFLNLLGVRLLPPQAASTVLLFKLAKPAPKPLEIPRGTRVSVARPEAGTEAPVFVTAQSVSIPAGQTQIESLAFHCDLVETELLGQGTGAAGLTLAVARPPIIGSTNGALDLVLAVEATADELSDRVPARAFAGKSFRIWREVDNFTESGPDRFVYVADHAAGTITFAPSVRLREQDGSLATVAAALAEIPLAGRQIRAWYGTGGGPLGNVAPQTLTVLKSTIPGVTVSNPSAAVGGRSAETVENALIRGPQEVRSLQRAVTARDFELLARRSGAVGRAKAYTKAALWSYASPGTVEVILVPFLDQQKLQHGVTRDDLKAVESEDIRNQIQQSLDIHRPLGTRCLVTWASYKTVTVQCRIVAHADADVIDLRARVLQRIYDLINPLPAGVHSGWRFGQALRSSNLYDAALAEPGVIYVDNIKLIVEEIPDADVACVAKDSFQLKTWYAGSRSALYRSMDDGDGWVVIGAFPGQAVTAIQSHPLLPGLLAIVTHDADQSPNSHVYLSFDCGENWIEQASTTYEISDAAWVDRDGAHLLMIATAVGLFELSSTPGASPVQVFIRPDDEKIGYYAVTAAHLKTGVTVAIASRAMGGVYLSDEAGKSNTFRNIGHAGDDVRVLAVQVTGGRAFLWAGLATVVGDPGKGCSSWSILGNGQDAPEDWQQFNTQWLGGSCVELAFQGDRIFAATYDAGVLWLEERATGQAWHVPGIDCGLPQSSREHPFDRVDALATDPANTTILVGGRLGTFRSTDAGEHFDNVSRKTFTDRVTLPQNWLFCSGQHQVEVITQDEDSQN